MKKKPLLAKRNVAGKKTIFLLPLVAFIVLMVFSRLAKYTIFYKASINGKIDTIYRNRDDVMLRVNGVDFSIIPVPTDNEPWLDHIGKIGDSVFKRANSDSLFLTQIGTGVFRYTVKKY